MDVAEGTGDRLRRFPESELHGLCVLRLRRVVVAPAAAGRGGRDVRGAASCWRSPKGKRWLYASADGAPNGLRKILLGPGRAGESRLAVSGKGAQLLLGTLQSGSLPSTRTQLQAGEVCWETTQ